MDWLLTVRETAEWFESLGIWAIVISVLLNIVINIIAVIPPFFLAGANAAVFGLWPGFWISLLGESLGTICAYWVYRQALNRWGETGVAQRLPFLNPKQWRWITYLRGRTRAQQNSVMMVARLTPFMPSPLVTFAAAAIGSKFIDFTIITVIGKAPSIFLETVIGHDLLSIEENWPRLFVAIAIMILMYIIFKRWFEATDARDRL